ncbi:protein-glutamate O-methyltransferase CheR [Paraferrimonas sp. SM1919]|uniref:CheR family methyltransferase n=1 Tax=Paraferrimonas sp. SM1919 TaxID=2662263 RepID=UPI0013D5FBE0|nr:protein-glutamate O-methyltransferase CheR [Paraferrimonas sp. SM1919]
MPTIDHRHFSDKEFLRVKELLLANTGITLNNSKKNLVYNRLVTRLRATKIDDFTTYINLVSDTNSSEMPYFINALTTNLTYFYREQYHFEMLRAQLIAMIRAKQLDYPIRVWSAGCSSGEEAYTIAIEMIELFGSLHPPIKILATDINVEALKNAVKGIYRLEQLERLTIEQKDRYFIYHKLDNSYQIREEVKSLVQFNYLNLIDKAWPLTRSFDVIFCRNVLIYFDKVTQQAITLHLAKYLKKGGFLFLGHSESYHKNNDDHTHEALQLVKRTMYIKH